IPPVEQVSEVVERVHHDRERVPELVRDPGRELPDRRHLLRLDELALEALAVGDVDADELDPAARSILDVARVREDRYRVAPTREEMEVVPARVSALQRGAPQRGRQRALAGGMDVAARPYEELLANATVLALGVVAR